MQVVMAGAVERTSTVWELWVSTHRANPHISASETQKHQVANIRLLICAEVLYSSETTAVLLN